MSEVPLQGLAGLPSVSCKGLGRLNVCVLTTARLRTRTVYPLAAARLKSREPKEIQPSPPLQGLLEVNITHFLWAVLKGYFAHGIPPPPKILP